MSGRFAERRQAARRSGRRRTLLRAGVGVLVAALVAGAVYAVWFSSALSVEKVRIEGLQTLKEPDVARIAAVELGQPLARVDTTAVHARIARIKRVEQVDVSRSWPHTLTISIVEREAVAYSGESRPYSGIDRFGIEFRTFSSVPKLPQVRVSTRDPRKRQQAYETLAEVVADLRKLYPELLDATAYLTAESRDSVRLSISKGRTVVWGSDAEPEDKVKVLRALLGSVRAKTYNVSAPDQPTTGN